MTRELLLKLVLNSLDTGNALDFTSLLISNNELAKTFDATELSAINSTFKWALTQYPDAFNYLRECHLYKKNDMGAFVNESPSLVTVQPGWTRCYTSLKMQAQGLPDCIDMNTVTGEMRGVEFKNYSGRQTLPELQYNNSRFEIFTKPSIIAYYKYNNPSSRVYSYNEIADLSKHSYSYIQMHNRTQNSSPSIEFLRKEFIRLHKK